MLKIKKIEAQKYKKKHFINFHKGSVGKKIAICKKNSSNQICNEGIEGQID